VFDKYGTEEELRRNLRDVADHATIVPERVDGFRQMLSDIPSVNATLVSQARNEELKALSESTYDQNEQARGRRAGVVIGPPPGPARRRLRARLPRPRPAPCLRETPSFGPRPAFDRTSSAVKSPLPAPDSQGPRRSGWWARR